MLKAAVIGVGSFGRNHARVLAEMDGIELVGVCDTNPENLRRVRKNGAREYLDYRQMLKREHPDVVFLVVPTRKHHSIGLEVLNAGVHLFVEKPIASTLEEAQELIECAREKGLKLTVGHIERFNPAIVELKRRMDNGELGRVYRIGVSRMGPFPTRIRDVGVVIDLAVHDIDIARFLVNDEVDHLYAKTERRIHTEHEDLLTAIIAFRNKTIANLNIDWLTPAKIRQLQIVGEKGLFVADYLTQELVFHENGHINSQFDYADLMRGVSVGKRTIISVPKREPLKVELEHFVDCVANNKQPLVSGEDGLKALELAMDIIRSSNTNRVIMK